jgi:hypothetical protein
MNPRFLPGLLSLFIGVQGCGGSSTAPTGDAFDPYLKSQIATHTIQEVGRAKEMMAADFSRPILILRS